ncbi:MAG: DUF362 domain-containing protein [Planctomycetes bacterium]|nr:DUF362 domain-containing protein [Planctomycetota bacterium]
MSHAHEPRISRRQLIGAAGLLAAGGAIGVGGAAWKRHERGLRAEVFIARAAGYDCDLVAAIEHSLDELGVMREEIRGKRVLLKPNLVETAIGKQHINTHPAVLAAAAEVFRRRDAAEVLVAEGQGHRRDSLLVLEESGTQHAIREAKLPFFDLNHDEVESVANVGRWTSLSELHLPRTLLGADFIVSLPKLKTHHWAGVTCSMKNFFGVMPGIVYGWPKNVLHWHGIPQSILDINAAVRPHLAIVDGIVGMEGDGPIMGTPKPVGCLIVGRNLPAVDATATRVMGLNVSGVEYLVRASGKLGPIQEHNIRQRGETIASVRTRFQVLDVPHLRGLASV